MKVIVAGGRNYQLTVADFELLGTMSKILGMTELVSGLAEGVDTDAVRWARLHGMPVKDFPPDYARYAHNAPKIRNAAMGDYADVLVAFPGGTGTQHMINYMRDVQRKPTWVVNGEEVTCFNMANF